MLINGIILINVREISLRQSNPPQNLKQPLTWDYKFIMYIKTFSRYKYILKYPIKTEQKA
jgi:hypothetical protein